MPELEWEVTVLPAPTGATGQPIFVQPGTAREFPLGSDLAGVTSIDYALSTVSGRLALAQAILRRLTTPRGGLVGDPIYGYDVLTLLGASVPESIIEQRVLEQVLLEEEVEDASCQVSFDGSSLTVEVRVVIAEGPFDLTLTADELTVEALIDGVPLFQEAA